MNRAKYRAYPAGDNDVGRRVEIVLRRMLSTHSLGEMHRALRRGLILLNGERIKRGRRLNKGDVFWFYKALPPWQEEPFSCGIPLSPGWIVHENSHLLVLNKPAGLLIHGGAHSLEERVRFYLRPRSSPSLAFRPGPLHRLDRNTSGLVAFSASLEGTRRFLDVQSEGKMKKGYLTFVEGQVKTIQVWEDGLCRDKFRRTTLLSEKGRRAVTKVIPLAAGDDRTALLVVIEKGRTHQIRAQCAAHGHPLVGDGKYGTATRKRQACVLHALFLMVEGDDAILGFSLLRAPLSQRTVAMWTETVGGRPNLIHWERIFREEVGAL